MMYCFIEEELHSIPEDDPFFLQAKYAELQNQFCTVNSKDGRIKDGRGNFPDVMGKQVMLRSSYDSMRKGISFLQKQGVQLLEQQKDIEVIEAWHSLHLTQRKIYSLTCHELLNGIYEREIQRVLEEEEYVFLKTQRKGFSAKVHTDVILQGQNRLKEILQKYCQYPEDKLLLSQYCTLKRDSMGSIESRHMVFKHAVINSSRCFRSIKHNVPWKLIQEAENIITKIKEYDFPDSYVLDMGIFRKGEKEYVDVVEINPITCSMCYVNNSIFLTQNSNLEKIQKRWGMGAEYCLDYSKHPERYFSQRITTEEYGYQNVDRYIIEAT